LELILLPLIFGIISFFIPRSWVKTTNVLFAFASLVAISIKCVFFNPDFMEIIYDPIAHSRIGMTFEFGYDGIGLIMLMLSNLVVFLVALSNFNRTEGSSPLFNGLLFLMQFGLNGLFISQDAILFYVFWEFTLIPIFFILYWFGAKDNQRNLLKFFLYTLLGSLGMLLSILYMASFSNSFGYEDLLYSAIPAKAACWIMTGFLIAFAVKIPLFPFHTWQPPTYATAPMAGTMMLSAIMLKMALFGMMKWMIPLSFDGLENWKLIIVILGIVGILYGAFIAMREKDIKKVFAFASISHLGLIAAGIMIFTMQSLQGAMVQMVNHSLIAIGLFLCADILEKRFGTRDLTAMGGVAKIAPMFGFWYAVITFIALSVPMTAGFIGEFFLIKSIFDYQWILGVLASLTLVLGAVYMIRTYQMSSIGALKINTFQDLQWNEITVFVIIAILAVAIGLYPSLVLDFVKPSIQNMLNAVKDSNTLIR